MQDGLVLREEQKYTASAVLFLPKVKSKSADLLFGRLNFLSESHLNSSRFTLFLIAHLPIGRLNFLSESYLNRPSSTLFLTTHPLFRRLNFLSKSHFNNLDTTLCLDSILRSYLNNSRMFFYILTL